MTEAAALSAYVEGTISFNALRNVIAGSTHFVFQPNGTIRVTSHRPLPLVTVRASDVQRVLARYQSGHLTLEEVSTWGLVLHSLDAFEVQAASESDEEEVWDVIGQLSVASVNNAFDADRVSQLLTRVGHVRE